MPPPIQCHLQCQTLRPEPRKIEVFAALGYNLHLELASRCTFSCVWPSYLAKPRLRPQKTSQNARPETGKQHGLAGSTDPFLNHISPSPGAKRHGCTCGCCCCCSSSKNPSQGALPLAGRGRRIMLCKETEGLGFDHSS